MGRKKAAVPWLASLVAHGALVGLATCLVGSSPKSEAPALIAIDIIDAPGPAAPPSEDRVEARPGQAGRPAAGAPPSPAHRDRSPRRSKAPTSLVPIEAPAVSELPDELAESSPPAGTSVTEMLGIELDGKGLGGMSAEALGGRGGDGLGGFGGGAGPGRGDQGTGLGRGGSNKKSTRSKRARSKARPARLIYPKRFRKERQGEVFVVILTVDSDGYIDGVRLEQGVNPHQDEKALNAVWRFRYDPARDRAGRPIKSRVVQRFMVY